MAEAFVIRNQLGHFWGKSKLWLDGTDPRGILQLRHRDEALNTLFELSAKDVELRGDILAVALNDKGQPVVEPSSHPVPGAEPGERDPGVLSSGT